MLVLKKEKINSMHRGEGKWLAGYRSSYSKEIIGYKRMYEGARESNAWPCCPKGEASWFPGSVQSKRSAKEFSRASSSNTP